jgi:hypothetical protein
MFGLVTKGQLLMALEVTQALRKDLKEEREEVKRLTNVIIQMRQGGFNLSPEHTDERWPGGRYVIADYEQEMVASQPMSPPVEQDGEAARVEQELSAMIERDLARVFGAEDAED